MMLMAGVAAGALTALTAERGYAQATDPNAAPNPYKMQENWAQLPDGRKWGSAIKVQVDHTMTARASGCSTVARPPIVPIP